MPAQPLTLLARNDGSRIRAALALAITSEL